MSNNIVLLSGSPRKGANTDRLAAAFTEGAKSAGKQVTVFRVADMAIGGCKGCMHCFKEKGVCIQKDDMPMILSALQKADTIVLASPVYYFSITAQLKLAIDRTFALINDKPPIQKAALLLTCGDEGTGAADGSITTYKQICGYSKWENAGIIIATGLHKPNDIEGREALDKARELGKEI